MYIFGLCIFCNGNQKKKKPFVRQLNKCKTNQKKMFFPYFCFIFCATVTFWLLLLSWLMSFCCARISEKKIEYIFIFERQRPTDETI